MKIVLEVDEDTDYLSRPLYETTMADVSQVNRRKSLNSEPRSIPQPIDINLSHANPVVAPNGSSHVRNGHLNLDTFSPVDQNGSFAFDRVLKSGEVHKRTRKTKVSCQLMLCSIRSS